MMLDLFCTYADHLAIATALAVIVIGCAVLLLFRDLRRLAVEVDDNRMANDKFDRDLLGIDRNQERRLQAVERFVKGPEGKRRQRKQRAG